MWHRCSWCISQQCEVLKTPAPHQPQFFVTAITFVSCFFLPHSCQVSALRIATAVLGKESRCVSIPQSYTAHLKHSVVTEDIHFSQVTSPCTNSMTRSNLLMRSGRFSSGRKSLKKCDEQFTSSTSSTSFRSVLRRHGYHESAISAIGIC